MSNLSEIELAIKGFTEETGRALDGHDQRIGALQEHFRVLEQHLMEGLSSPQQKGHVDGAFTLANELLRNQDVMNVARKASQRTAIEIPASQILGFKNSIVTGGFFNSADGGIHTGLERRRFVSDFLSVVPVSQGSVSWSRETAFTNAAAIQAGEGGAKPESTLSFELIDSTIPTLAHWLKVSNQALSDLPQLINLIGNRLRYGLSVKLDDLIVNGAGTGWTATGNHVPFVPVAGESGIDSISRAIAEIELSDASPSLVLLNPADFRGLQRLKSTGSGVYLFGSPAGQNSEGVWNTTVLPTTAIAAGKLLVVDTAQQGTLFLREDSRLDLGYVDQDFVKNLATARVEMRALNVVIRPSAVVYGDLGLA